MLNSFQNFMTLERQYREGIVVTSAEKIENFQCGREIT